MEKSQKIHIRSDTQSAQSDPKNQSEINHDYFKWKAPLHIPMYTIAFLSFIYPPLVGVFCLVVYYLEGRIAGYLPTISETATEYPNTKFFAQFISTGAMTTIATLFCYFNYFVITRKNQYSYKKETLNEKKLNFEKNFSPLERTLQILIFTSALGIVALGFSPINEAHSRHLMSAVTGFLSILMFEFLAFLNDPNKKCSKLVKIIRWSAWLIAFFSFILFAAAKWVFSHRIDVTISTFAEWALLVFMLFIWSTWKNELNSIEFSIVIL